MPKQPYRLDPSQKFFDVNEDFSGGMNTTESDSTMANNQLRLIQNMELTTKGSLVKREGLVQIHKVNGTGTGIGFQGHFEYFGKDTIKREFYGYNGSIYDVNNNVVNYKNLSKVNVPASGFQGTRQMASLVYNNVMIVATGTKLLEFGYFYDDETETTQSYYFRELEPYRPKAIEYSNLGGNLLSPDPDNFISDGTASIIVNEGITTVNRTPTINIPEILETYLSKPSATAVSIRWEVMFTDATNPTWVDINGGWKPVDMTTKANKKIEYAFDKFGSWSIRSVLTATSNLTGQNLIDATKVYGYIISGVKVTPTEDIEPDEAYTPQTCNRLLLYYDQVLMWGDTSVRNALYIADVFKPSYVPSDNVILLETPQEDSITAVIYFYDLLVLFTENNIFSLSGTTPISFVLQSVNRTIGCIAPYSAVAVQNYVVFLSNEGIYKLKTLSTINLDRFNVDKIDLDIWNIIPRPYDKDAIGVQSGLVYMLNFPNHNLRVKWFYQQDVWALDKSPSLDFKFAKVQSGISYAYRPNGTVLKGDGNVYTDEGIPFSCMFETKDYDVGYPFHQKKFKNLKVNLLNDAEVSSVAYLTVYVDQTAIINPEKYDVFETEDAQIMWDYRKTENIILYSGTKIGSWILGNTKLGIIPTIMEKFRLTRKGHTVRIKIEHKSNSDFGILGYALVFKIKKP